MTPPLFPQLLLDTHDELIVDLFAGGGGASLGIEMATGRQVDVAVNHDEAAIAMHRINHPQTEHHVADVFEVDPMEVAGDRPIGLLWASPDCTDHSKAKGGKPIRNRKRRALAWVVKRWAGQVRPRVICLENVEEFVDWGPLVGPPGKLRRCPRRKGKTFRRFVRDLEGLGYDIEWRELRACDYGAPTIRKRLFLVARCDGRPIVWPEATHGPGTRRRYRSAASCIDWSIPMLSIFATPEEAKVWARARRAEGWQMGTPRRPLAEATLRRIARGVVRYVLEAPQPFIVPMQHRNRPVGLNEPLQTVTTQGNKFNLVVPYLVPRYGERDGQEPRTLDVQEPHPTVVPTGNGGMLAAAHLQRDFGASVGSPAGEPVGTIRPGGGGKAAVVASFLARHWGGMTGKDLREPHPTVLTKGAQDQVVAASLTKLRGTSLDADPADPLHTVSAGGTHHGAVSAFLSKYYGEGVGQGLDGPAPTATTKDRMGLVTVELEGEPFVIVDIAMRMLQPRELYRAQGFHEGYVIDRGPGGRRLTKTEQVRMVGNSVCPPQAAALVAAQVPEMVVRDEARRAA